MQWNMIDTYAANLHISKHPPNWIALKILFSLVFLIFSRLISLYLLHIHIHARKHHIYVWMCVFPRNHKWLLSYKEPTRCNCVVEFIIPLFLNCSTCFGRHTAHHQELKNCNCSLWSYVRFWLPVAAAMAQPSQRQPTTKKVCKTRGCS